MSNIYVYSRGNYENLDEDFLMDKAVIRIHNVRDVNWYPNKEGKRLVLFFNDIKIETLSWIEKTKANLGFKTKHFNKLLAQETVEYIKANKGKDFVVHCEYGKSRSVAVAIFLRDQLGYKIANKDSDELLKYNDWVLYLLKKFY